MKPAEKMEILVRRFCDAKKSSVKTSAEMDSRVLGEAFGAYDKSRTKESAASQPGVWRIIMKSRMVKLAAAAVIIAAALIGMKVLFGLGEQPAEVPVAQPAVSGELMEDSDSQVDIELRQVRQMYAVGDVKGLAAMLAEGQFESKLLAANYLAQMDDGIQALEALENVQAQYGKHDPGNPFTPAVQRIRNRTGAASGQGSPPSVIARGQPLVKQGPDQAPPAAVVVDTEEMQALANAESSDAAAKVQAEQRAGHVLADSTTGPVLTKGVSGNAYYFDGVNDYIDFDVLGPVGNSPRTLSLWAATTSVSPQYMLSYGGTAEGVGTTFRPGLCAGSCGWGRCEGVAFDISNSAVTYGAQVTDGKWHHYGFVVPDMDKVGLRDVRVYRDGTLLSSICASIGSSVSLNTEADNPIDIGRHYEDRCYFCGTIDDVALFDRALSAEEIQRLYQSPGSLRSNEPGLIGYWNFDSDRGDIVKDSSRYGNDGRLSQGHSESSVEASEERGDGECRPELTEGASGYGYYFDGDGDYIEIPPIEGLGAEQTKMLWIYPEVWPMPRDVYVLDEGGHQSNNNWIELLDSDGNGVPNIRAGFDAGNLFDSDGNVEVGYWYHIAVVSTSAGDVYTYINGVFDSSRSGFSATTEPGAIVIGADGETRGACFKGIIDEVAIFDRALSDDEIWQIYQNTGRLRGNEPGLVGYWNFDRDDGDTVRDMSRYGNNGKLGQAAPAAAGGSTPVIHVD